MTTTWTGRRGTVVLGPTEHRVARWLADRTRRGWITLRTTAIAEACNLERSEAYRILRRLRELGLFGIRDDRGGTRGGRQIWRTAIEHDGAGLDAVRHREAWARIRGWAAAARARTAARLARIRTTHAPRSAARAGSGASSALELHDRPAQAMELGPGATFLDRLIAAGLPAHLIASFTEHRHR